MKSKTVTLKFYSTEKMGQFVRSCKVGNFANVIDLSVEGNFSKQLVDQAINQHGAIIISAKAKSSLSGIGIYFSTSIISGNNLFFSSRT